MKYKIMIVTLLISAYPTPFVSPQTIHALRGSEGQNPRAQEVEFMRGADASFLDQIEDHGGVYTQDGMAKDALQIFSDCSFNYIRLRLWHTPEDEYNTLERTLNMAQRVRDKGMNILLLPHYSDTWADPGHQTKPSVWDDLPFEVLKDSLYQYNMLLSGP